MGNISAVVNKVLGGLEEGVIAEGKMGSIGGVFDRAQGQVLFIKEGSNFFDASESAHLKAAGFYLLQKPLKKEQVLVYNWAGMLAKDEEADAAKEAARAAEKAQKIAARRLQVIRTIHERDLTAGRVIQEHLRGLDNVQLTPVDKGLSADRLKLKAGSPGIPTLFISDVHYAEKVDAKQIGGLNSYGVSIADKRIQTLFSNTQKLVSDYVKIDNNALVVALGGDMLSGNIHDELRETNDLPIIEAARQLAYQLSQGIHEMAGAFQSIHVPCVVGNHGRMSHKPAAKGAVDNNFDHLVYLFMAEILKQDRNVMLHISDSLDLDFQIFNTRYKLTHGDQFKCAGGVGGIWPPLMKGNANKQKRAAALGQSYDYLMMAHFHQLGFVESLIVNGSVKGYDEYAFRMNLPFERPQQGLWLTHPQEGLTIKMPVFCDEGIEKAKRAANGCAFALSA